ncbi:FAD-binding protein [Streptomyces lydicus]|nr:FAD-binding protein [Streptomyces lydicus]
MERPHTAAAPRAIVRAASEDDVLQAVTYARTHGLRLSVRSGGHNWSGAPLRDDALLLDLSGLDECTVHPATGTAPATATVGPAVTGQDLVAALTPQHLAFPVGHCPTVAVGGFLLSGGLGWNSRAWGASCADVLEIRAVTAEGRTVDCSETRHPDLFWAARAPDRASPPSSPASGSPCTRTPGRSWRPGAPCPGGHRAGHAVGRAARAPAPAVRRNGLRADGRRPGDALGPAGPRITVAATAFAASPAQARQVLEPFADCPFDDLAVAGQPPAPTSYAALHEGAASVWPPGHRYAADTLWSPDSYRTQLTRIADAVARAPSPASLVLAPVQPVSEDPAHLRTMAFAPLGTSYLVCYALWDDPAEDAAQDRWLREAMTAVDPQGDGRHYIAEADLEAGRERARHSYPPATWDRLRDVRDRWDPHHLLHSYLTP